MCFLVKNSMVKDYAKDGSMCLQPVSLYALYQVTEFVIDIDEKNSDGTYKNWFIQRMEGKIIGALAYAAIIIANAVECVVFLALGLLALLPSLMVEGGYARAMGTCVVSVMLFFEIPVRCVSAIIQNILLGCRKDFEELHLGSMCTTSQAFEVEARAATDGSSQQLAEMP